MREVRVNSGIRTKRIAAWRGMVAFAVVAACVAIAPMAVNAAVKIGKTTIIVSKVTGTIEKTLRVLALEDDVHQDEVVEAAKASASEIVFLDNTRIAIGPNTRLTLDRFVFDPDRGKGTMEMTLLEGVFRFTSGGISETPKADYVVHTPTATIGIRGTIVSTVIGDDGQVATVLETASVVTIAGQDGMIKTLDTPGTAITASADGVLGDPGEPPVWALKRIAELRALLAGPTSDTAGGRDVDRSSPASSPDPAPPAEPPAVEPPSTGRGLAEATSVASPSAQSDASRGLGKATDRSDTSAEGNASHGRGQGNAGNSGNGPGGSAAGGGSAGAAGGPGGSGPGGGSGNGNGPGGNGNGPGGAGGNGPGGGGAGGRN